MPLRSKVAMLPAEMRNELERRIVEQAFSGYQDLAEWLQAQGYQIAHDSVQRHGSRLQHKIELMERAAAENHAIAAVAAQAGDAIVDTSIQLIHYKVVSMLIDDYQRESEPSEESSNAGVPASASQQEEGGAALGLPDLVRLTRIVADLNRVAVARQRQAEARSRLERPERGAGKGNAKTKGGLSTETYQTIYNILIGREYGDEPSDTEVPGTPYAQAGQQSGEESGGSDVSAAASHLDGSRTERNEKFQAQLDADKRTSTPKTCSTAPPLESASRAKTSPRAADQAQMHRTVEDAPVAASCKPPASGIIIAPSRGSPRVTMHFHENGTPAAHSAVSDLQVSDST